MNSEPTTADALLELWISVHGNMDPRLHPVFKRRAELDELIHYEHSVLEKAFSSSPKLTEILLAARRLDPDPHRELNPTRNNMSPRRSETPKTQDGPNKPEVLPLPGDPGLTRRPGKKREDYRIGEEAELRHIARQHQWW